MTDIHQRFTIRLLALTLFALTLASCTSQEPIVVPTPQDTAFVMNPPAQSGAEAVNAFAFDAYDAIASGTDGNVFFSPISIATALTMTYEGARGDTATQMASVLHLPTDRVALRDFYSEFLHRSSPSYTLTMANSIWPQKGYPFKHDFTERLSVTYDAAAQALDYRDDLEKSRVTINAWVEDKTNDRIKDLIPAGVLSPDTRMVLTNAIYMKADWRFQFEKDDTFKEAFRTASGVKDVDMMHQTNNFRYAEDAGAQVLEMAYKGDDLSMIVILPKEDVTVAGGSLESYLSLPREIEAVRVSLPTFEMTQPLDITGTLRAMGMPLALSSDADFSGMTDTDELFINTVLHKAFVKVDEKGTEAAAATAVGMRVTSAMDQPEPIEFKADHPFIVIIKDNKSGAILFMGRVMEP